MARPSPVERYSLYGEPIREVELNFMHLEPIPLRSSRFDWVIEPHSHADLHQILFVRAGCGTMHTEGEEIALPAPSLVIMPSGIAHGYTFEPGTDGWSITLAVALIEEIARIDPAALSLFGRLSWAKPVPAADAATLQQLLSRLAQEMVWSAPMRRMAVRADLMRLLVASARLVGSVSGETPLSSKDVALTEAFRRLIETHFRGSAPVAFYARALGVSEDKLLSTCRGRFGDTPIQMLHRRLVVEAQRWLAYTNRDIGEISRELGFQDAAYFSRFFKRRTSLTPTEYRKASLNRAD